MTTTERAESPDATTRHPVDRVPPVPQLLVLGLQHVLAMYAGAVAVPLIVGGAMIKAGQLQPTDLPHLIVADLFVAGIASILQATGPKYFGARLPLMQGVTFAAVGPMITIGSQYGVTAIYGSVIATGVFMILLAPFFARMVRLFPPLVTGTVITIIGISLMTVAAGWVSGTAGNTESPDFGRPVYIGLAFFTLLAIIVANRMLPQRWKSVAVLTGILIGTIVAALVGQTDWSEVGSAPWVAVPQPFMFGLPTFHLGPVISMLLVGLVIMTETTGDTIAVGEIVDRPVTPRTLAAALRADGLGTVLGGIFNTFPYTAFAQNVGLVGMSKIRSRHVATAAGCMLIVLGLIPKMGEIVAAIPSPVLGGAGIALFGIVAASGIRTIAKVDLTDTRLLIVAISIGVALLPTMLDGLYDKFPAWTHSLLDSGISAGALTAVVLNLILDRESVFGKDAHTLADAEARESAQL